MCTKKYFYLYQRNFHKIISFNRKRFKKFMKFNSIKNLFRATLQNFIFNKIFCQKVKIIKKNLQNFPKEIQCSRKLSFYFFFSISRNFIFFLISKVNSFIANFCKILFSIKIKKSFSLRIFN